MRKNITKPLSVALAAAVLIAGCTSKEASTGQGTATQEPGKPSAPSNEVVTLRMGYWAGSQATTDATNKVVERFEKQYPNIKIESEFAPFESYFDKLSVQAASNSLPDIVRQDYKYLALYAKRDLLLNLDDLIKSNAINLTSVPKVYTDAGLVDNKMYGINVGNNALVFMYDPQAFEKAGVAQPSEKWTWDDYEKAVKDIRDKTGMYGAMRPGVVDIFPVYLREQGKSLYNKEGTALGYEDDQPFIDFFEMQLRLQQAKAYPPLAEELEAKGIDDNLFAKGKTAISASLWSNNIDLLEKTTGKSLKMVMVPGSGDGKGMYIKPSQFISVAKSTKHPKEAAAFIDFWMNDVEANKALNAYFGFPYVPSVVEAMKPSLTDSQKKASDYLQVVEKYAAPISPPDPDKAGEVIKILDNVGQEIFFERISVKDGAAKFRKEANEILAKNKK